jgi:glycyl-tRNA synthetase
MVDMDTIFSLCKRRGFVFPSSEIYGGLASTYDYGPLGVEMKRNIRDSWWRTFITGRDDCVGMESSILMHPKVWATSGHLASFSDPLVECRTCHHRFRADQLPDASKCPDCGGALTAPRQFNLMFKTFLGPVEDDASLAYLRPETAQGIFVNFLNVLTATRRKLPFGIGQQGKSFRNEITVGNFIFRTREFEQMELEFFVQPGTDDDWHAKWIQAFVDWFHGMGIAPDKLRVRPHEKEELSHYSKATSDIEYAFPWGWGELMGIANRTDYDLRKHTEATGVKLEYFDPDTSGHVVPYVIEPACGVDRILLTLLINAYAEEEVPEREGPSGPSLIAREGEGRTEKRVVLRLHPSIAPVKVAVLPLSRNARLAPKAREVYDLVRKHFIAQYDDAQSIGRRYRRQDEIGTPLCVTVDFQTVEQDSDLVGTVTIRDRDTMQQARVPLPDLVAALREKLALQ